jgi:hypothetical protein
MKFRRVDEEVNNQPNRGRIGTRGFIIRFDTKLMKIDSISTPPCGSSPEIEMTYEII